MLKIIAATAALGLYAMPAFAGCADFSQPEINPASVEICEAGHCERTVEAAVCGNVNGTGTYYENGWAFVTGERAPNGEMAIVRPDGSMVPPLDWRGLSCRLVDSPKRPARYSTRGTKRH